jgi:hypothetical protein
VNKGDEEFVVGDLFLLRFKTKFSFIQNEMGSVFSQEVPEVY